MRLAPLLRLEVARTKTRGEASHHSVPVYRLLFHLDGIALPPALRSRKSRSKPSRYFSGSVHPLKSPMCRCLLIEAAPAS